MAEALYNFDGQRSDQLSFKRGDILYVYEMPESGWWLGKDSSGRSGIFPYNYVQLHSDDPAAYPVVRALFDFHGTTEEDLSFVEDELITVTADLNEDWYMGRNQRGETGHIPKNYVEKTDQWDEEAAREENEEWIKHEQNIRLEAETAYRQKAEVEHIVHTRQAEKEDPELQKAMRLMREAEDMARKAERALKQLQMDNAERKRASVRAIKNLDMVDEKAIQAERDRMMIEEKAAQAAANFEGFSPGPPPEPAHESDDESVISGLDDDDERASKRSSIKETVRKSLRKFKYNAKFKGLGGGKGCKKCGKPVGFADKVRALNADWHKECFVCSTCNKVLRQGNYKDNKGSPYCPQCHSAVSKFALAFVFVSCFGRETLDHLVLSMLHYNLRIPALTRNPNEIRASGPRALEWEA